MRLLKLLSLSKREDLDLISIGSILLFIKLLVVNSLFYLLIFSVLTMIYQVTLEILKHRKKNTESNLTLRIDALEREISSLNTVLTLRGRHG